MKHTQQHIVAALRAGASLYKFGGTHRYGGHWLASNDGQTAPQRVRASTVRDMVAQGLLEESPAGNQWDTNYKLANGGDL